jgi:hypothetical protein
MAQQSEHLRRAEECLAAADRAIREKDRETWLRLAQSWLRLIEDTERSNANDGYPNFRAAAAGAAAQIFDRYSINLTPSPIRARTSS